MIENQYINEEKLLNFKNEILKKGWQPCTDNNYWETEYDVVCITINDEEYIFSRNDCPYGWNVLVNSRAKFFSMKPIIDVR